MPSCRRCRQAAYAARVDEDIDPYAPHPVGADYISARGSRDFVGAFPGAYAMRPYTIAGGAPRTKKGCLKMIWKNQLRQPIFLRQN